jgi:hypothetical protein
VGVEAVTENDPDAPAAEIAVGPPGKDKVHPEADCAIVNVWPAAVTVPVREAPVLAATEKPTVPVPVPDAPVMVIHGALDAAVQAHEGAEALMARLPADPVAAADCATGDSV